MEALDKLNANLSALEVAVNEVKVKVDALKAASVDRAAVQAAADRVAAVSSTVSTLA